MQKTIEEELAEVPVELLTRLHKLIWANFEAYEILADAIGWEHKDSSPSLQAMSQIVCHLNIFIQPFVGELMERKGKSTTEFQYFQGGKIQMDFLPEAKDEGAEND